MSKLRFLAVFLGAFAVFLWLWSALDLTPPYTRALLWFAGILGPLTHGWLLEPALAGAKHPAWVKGATRIDLKIQFDSLVIGTVPLLALLAATPGVVWRRRAGQFGAGILLSFLLNAAVLTAFPMLLYYENQFTDILGTFIGLVGFVGAPVILWFVLAFAELRCWLPRLGAGAPAPRRN